MSKQNKVKVYMVWFNYLGQEQSRELIATFNHINWAKRFIEADSDAVDGKYTRLVIED